MMKRPEEYRKGNLLGPEMRHTLALRKLWSRYRRPRSILSWTWMMKRFVEWSEE